jgi:hypothetical protein
MAGLLPLALSAVVHYAWSSQPRAFDVPPRPALAFDQYLVDLEQIPVSSEVRATFAFRNRGAETVQITGVHPSCGCLEPQLSTRSVAPGEAGRIVLRMQPANESPGRKEYYADVRYTDPQPREVRLTFKVIVPDEGLTVQPKALLVYQNSRQPTHQQVVITDRRARRAEVLDVQSSHPLVEAAIGERRISPAGAVEQLVEVQISGDVPPGIHNALLTIQIDDPDLPVVRVPVRIVHQSSAAEAAP